MYASHRPSQLSWWKWTQSYQSQLRLFTLQIRSDSLTIILGPGYSSPLHLMHRIIICWCLSFLQQRFIFQYCRCKANNPKVDFILSPCCIPTYKFDEKGSFNFSENACTMWLIHKISTALAATNKFCSCVVYIVDRIIILFYQLLYILLWVMSSVLVPPGFW